MRNLLKKVFTVLAAGVMTASVVTLAACGANFTPPSGTVSGTAKSNGGFVVEVGDYYYFINGSESYTADNTYGTPVKGSLMRISKSGMNANEAETVIPSLMVAADYTSGIYIYNDRVYYATPNNVRNTSGEIEQDYLDFKSAKLNGTDIQNYMNVSVNSTAYRFVEVDGTVYLVYSENKELHSYNTETKTNVTLAKNVTNSVFDRNDKENPYIYYTMGVTMNIDDPDGNTTSRDYNQIYRVSAAATECPNEAIRNYEWNEEYLENNNGELPYINYGTIVLDGIGSIYRENSALYSPDVANVTPLTTTGYTYSLQSYENGGIYFKREVLAKTGTVGEDGWLYYLSEDKLASGWNSVAGNDESNLEIVARPTETGKASSSAFFYRDEKGHHYLYTESGSIFRADVDENGKSDETRIAQTSGTATLVSIDTESSPYQYAYYMLSNNVYRAVINGTKEDYRTLGYEANAPYRPVQILDIKHPSPNSWYGFEILNGLLFFADATSVGSATYNYVSFVDLTKNGALMDNVALKEYKEEYDAIIGSDGYIQELSKDGKTNLSTALKYYFQTGTTNLFYENIEEAEAETGKANTLYSQEEVEEFKAYTEAGNKVRSDFIKEIGKKTDADKEAIESYWQNTLQHYIAPVEEESEGLAAWAWAIIGVCIGVVVIAVGIGVYFVLRKKNDEPEREEKMFVDTTDDKSVDVYTDMDASAEETEETPAEEVEEAPVEETPAEEVEEAPVEEAPAEEVEEAPAEEAPAETSENPEN